MTTADYSSFAELTATQSSRIKRLLKEKQARDAEQVFVMEGAKPIRELLRVKSPAIEAVVVTQPYLDTCEPAVRRSLEAQRVYLCRNTLFEKLSDATTSQGILAVIKKPSWEQAGIFKRPQMLGIYGECLQDPTNVGTIIRTAAAFGLDGLWLSADSVDVFNPKIVRATAGTLLKLPVFIVKDAGNLARFQCTLLAADSTGKHARRLDEITSISTKTIIAVGNESRGLSSDTLRAAAIRFHIPISQDAESLNVAASAAIAAFYFSRLPRE
ncbi:MAG: RNA methyltransferase [Nitrospiraceae bacterium]|nr:RNA methyltransferase [Nitrospiraceae bacterium]